MAIEEIRITTVVDDQGSRKTLRDLQKEVKGYRSDLLNLDRSSEEYRQTLNKLAETQGRINTVNRDVAASTQNLTNVYASLSSVVGGVVGGFTAVQSAAVLLGADNDKLAETFVRLQASMALIQSLTALSSAIRAARIAMIAFNTAVASNPLVAFAIAVVAVTTAIAALTVGIINNRRETDALAESYNTLQRSISLASDEVEREIKFLQAAGVAADELIQVRRRALNQQISDLEAALDAMDKKRATANRKERKQLTEQINAITAQLNTFYDQRQKLNDDYTVFEIQTEKKRRDDAIKSAQQAREKAMAEEKAARDKALREAEAAAAERLKLEQQLEQGIKGVTQIELDRAIAVENQIARQIDLQKAIQFEIDDNLKLQESLRALISDPDASIEAQIKATKELADAIQQGYTLQDELQTENNARLKAQVEEEIKLQELALKREQELEKLKQKARQETFNISAQILSNTSKLLGEETAAGKATAIASTTISTYQAAMSAYASLAGIPIVGPGLGIAAAAAAITAGLANVKNIVATKIPGATDSSSGSSISLPSMPEITVPIQETHNNLSANDEEFFNQSTKVYVSETDIREVTHRVNVAESNARF